MMYEESRLAAYSLWHHPKRDINIVVFGIAICQTNGPDAGRSRAVVYREVNGDGTMHYREIGEFLDGRFVPLDEAIRERVVETPTEPHFFGHNRPVSEPGDQPVTYEMGEEG